MHHFPEVKNVDTTESKMAADLISRTNQSFFLTGKPGTGKTTFLQQVARQSLKKYIFLSPANEGAFAAEGTTIHSFFHLPYSPFVWELFTENQKNTFYNYRKEKRAIIEQVELVIIDDIASVRADTIDAIDFRLRNFGGKRSLPFGGKQMVFAGDIFQLVNHWPEEELHLLKSKYDTPFFFSARALMNAGLHTVEFKKLYFQYDQPFVNLLEKIRRKQMLLQDVEKINAQYVPGFLPTAAESFVTITSDNGTAEEINRQNLSELTAPLHLYTGKTAGRFVREINDDLLPTLETLALKENTPVVFVKNDVAGRWQRGMLATIWALKSDSVTVMFIKDGEFKLHQLETVKWENLRYEMDEATGQISTAIVGSFTQYPIRPAWALAIKKCQGMLFDKVIIETGKAGAGLGFTYTALARCTSLQGIKIKAPLNVGHILVKDELVRLLLSANDEKQLASAIADGEADLLYTKAVKEFNRGNFSLAVADVTKAIAIRNDTAKTLFKRFAAARLKTIKSPAGFEMIAAPELVIQQQKADSVIYLPAPMPQQPVYNTALYPQENGTLVKSNEQVLENNHQVNDFEENLQADNSGVESLQQELQGKANEMESLRRDLQNNRNELETLAAEWRNKDHEKESVAIRLQHITTEFETLKQELRQTNIVKESLVAKLKTQEENIAGITGELQLVRSEFETIKQELQHNRSELQNQVSERIIERQETETILRQLHSITNEFENIKKVLQNSVNELEVVKLAAANEREEAAGLKNQLQSSMDETERLNKAWQNSQQNLTEKLISFNEQLWLQRGEFGNLNDTVALLNDADKARGEEAKRTLGLNHALTAKIDTLKADLEKWKIITVIAGLVFCVVVTVALFVFFSV